MYIYITKQNERVFLTYPIDNRRGSCRIALKEIGFKVMWVNISEKAQNNWINVNDEVGDQVSHITIPDGYYNFCALKEVLSEFSILLRINEANLRITIHFPLEERREYTFPRGLARILGFHSSGGDDRFSTREDVYQFEGNSPSDFLVNPMLYVHLQQLKTCANVFNGYPSTVLRALPSITAGFCDYQLYRFGGDSEFKELIEGSLNSLDVKIANQGGKPVDCSDLLIVLEVEEHIRKVVRTQSRRR